MLKLSADGKSPHHNVRRNSGNLRSGNCACYCLLVSFIQSRLKFFNKMSHMTLLNFFLASRIAKNDIFLKVPPTHVLI